MCRRSTNRRLLKDAESLLRVVSLVVEITLRVVLLVAEIILKVVLFVVFVVEIIKKFLFL